MVDEGACETQSKKNNTGEKEQHQGFQRGPPP